MFTVRKKSQTPDYPLMKQMARLKGFGEMEKHNIAALRGPRDQVFHPPHFSDEEKESQRECPWLQSTIQTRNYSSFFMTLWYDSDMTSSHAIRKQGESSLEESMPIAPTSKWLLPKPGCMWLKWNTYETFHKTDVTKSQKVPNQSAPSLQQLIFAFLLFFWELHGTQDLLLFSRFTENSSPCQCFWMVQRYCSPSISPCLGSR